MADQIVITVLDDGTVKIETPGAISSANHGNAGQAIRALERALGGESKVEKLRPGHAHKHAHSHAHAGHKH